MEDRGVQHPPQVEKEWAHWSSWGLAPASTLTPSALSAASSSAFLASTISSVGRGPPLCQGRRQHHVSTPSPPCSPLKESGQASSQAYCYLAGEEA